MMFVIVEYVVHHNSQSEGAMMPMNDVYAPANLFPPESDVTLCGELTLAVLRAEGVAKPGPYHANNTAAFVHRLPATAVGTAASQPAAAVRVQIVTPPGALKREGQRQVTKEATELV